MTIEQQEAIVREIFGDLAEQITIHNRYVCVTNISLCGEPKSVAVSPMDCLTEEFYRSRVQTTYEFMQDCLKADGAQMGQS